MTISRAQRKAAGLVLLGYWNMVEHARIMMVSYVTRELANSCTPQEIKYLQGRTAEMKESNEKIRKLAWRLQNSA